MTKRGFAAMVFGRQNGRLDPIVTKLDTLMGNMVPHHVPNFCQKRPPDGGEIEDARYFWVRHSAHMPEPNRLGAKCSYLVER